MTAAIEKIGAAITVNTFTSGVQFTPVVTALLNGGYAIAWNNFGAPDYSVIDVQIFDAGGAKVGGEFGALGFTNGFSESEPDIATMDNGDFVVVATIDEQGDGSDLDVRGQRLTASGTKLPGSFPIAGADLSREHAPSLVAQFGTDNFLSTYSHGSAVGFLQLTGNGDGITTNYTVDANTTSDQRASEVTSLTNGDYTVAYQHNDDIYAVRLVNGAVSVRANTVTAGVQGTPSIAAFESGGYVVVWNDRGMRVGGQAYDSLGHATGGNFSLSTNGSKAGSLDQTAPKVIALAGGDFAVVWDSVDGIAIQGRSADGTRTTGPLLITSNGGGSLGNLDAMQKKDGDIVVTWGDDGSSTDVHAQVVRIMHEVIGTDFAEDGPSALTGGVSTLHPGFQENDWLKGLGGNDVLYGYGGAHDILDGGVGADEMHGGDGDDTYIVDNAGDIVDEVNSSGFDTVESSIDISLSSPNLKGTIEALVLTGGAGKIIGDSADNVLEGNKGADKIQGLDGDDTLKGKKGPDDLNGGKGADTFIGGKGPDDLFGGKDDDKDVFIFDKGDSGTKAGNIDQIFGFDRHQKHEKVSDKIDLTDLHLKMKDIDFDANKHGVKLLLDTHGNGKADMVIEVMHVNDLDRGDLIL